MSEGVETRTCAKCGGRIEPGRRTCIFGHIQLGGMSKSGQATAPVLKREPSPPASAPAPATAAPAAPTPAPGAPRPAPVPDREPAPALDKSVPQGATDGLTREKRLLMEKVAEIRRDRDDLDRAKAAYEQEAGLLHARSHDLEEREARIAREAEEIRLQKEDLETKGKVEGERARSREKQLREEEAALAKSVLRFEERGAELTERERMLKSQADRIKSESDLIDRDRGRVAEEVEKVRALWDTFQNGIAEVKRKAEQLAQLEGELGRTRADFVSLEARLKEREVESADLKLKLMMTQGQLERAVGRAPGEGAVSASPGVELQFPKPEAGQSYLMVTDDSSQIYATYSMLLEGGSDGVMVVTAHPDKLRKKFNISRGRAMWLTADRAPGSVHPARLDYELTRDLSRFFKEKAGGVILLDGIRTLVQANGFDKVANFMKRLCDLAATQNGIVLVPVPPDSFEPQQMTVIREAFDFVAEPPTAPGR